MNLDGLFCYHAPTERTAPIYAQIREAEVELVKVIDSLSVSFAQDVIENLGPDGIAKVNAIYYGQVNAAAKRLASLAEPAEAGAPLGDAAIVAASLARNAANEAIATRKDTGRLLAIAKTKAQEARWLACGSVAVSHAAWFPVPTTTAGGGR